MSTGLPEGFGPRTFVVAPSAAGRRLDLVLAAEFPQVSRTQFSRHVSEGAVTVNGKSAAPSRKLRAGEVIVWTPAAPRPSLELRAQDIPFFSFRRCTFYINFLARISPIFFCP